MYYPLLGSPVGGDIWYPVSSMKIESESIALILATFSEVLSEVQLPIVKSSESMSEDTSTVMF